MIDTCRCDTSTYTYGGMCDTCGRPQWEASAELLHKPPPALAHPPLAPVPPDPAPWRVCPSCGQENTEHKPKCPRANWNVRKDTPPLKFSESDSSYRVRLIGHGNRMNDLDRYAVLTVIGEGLDAIGRHIEVRRN